MAVDPDITKLLACGYDKYIENMLRTEAVWRASFNLPTAEECEAAWKAKPAYERAWITVKRNMRRWWDSSRRAVANRIYPADYDGDY